MKASKEFTSLIVVGAGGLAHAALAQILSTFFAPTEDTAKNPAKSTAAPDDRRLRITVIDFDLVELSNLNRQIFFTPSDIGSVKAESLLLRLREFFAISERDLRVELCSHTAKLEQSNIAEALGSADFVIDATDSVKAKLLINDFCTPRQIPFCYAGLSGDQGLVLPVLTDLSGPNTPCVRCVFPNFNDASVEHQELTCHAQGVVGANVGVVGSFQGQVFLDWLNGKKTEGLFSFSFSPLRTHRLRPPHNETCPCHQHAPAKVLDLTTERCPRTFLFTKLALEKLAPGEVLQVAFGSSESATNVKRSCEAEGYFCVLEQLRLEIKKHDVVAS